MSAVPGGGVAGSLRAAIFSVMSMFGPALAADPASTSVSPLVGAPVGFDESPAGSVAMVAAWLVPLPQTGAGVLVVAPRPPHALFSASPVVALLPVHWRVHTI